MKLDKKRIRDFEAVQKEHGTKVALYNVLWEVAADLLKSIGVKSIKTS